MSKVEIKVPAVGESIQEAEIGEWQKQDGDYVNRDEVLLVLETDKASVEVVAEAAGTLKISAAEGDTVEIGATIGEIDTSAEAPAGGAPAPAADAPAAPAAAPAAAAAAPTGTPSGVASPAAARVLGEKGIDPASVQGTGKGGHISKQDAMAAQSGGAASAPAPSAIPPLPTATRPSGGQRREKMTKIRRSIAKRLVEAQQNAAILTTFNEVDMKPLMDLRARYKEEFKEKYGTGLGFMGVFTKAAVEALKAWPGVNAFIDGDEVIYNDYYNVGIAVGTEKGLIVPVIRDADQLSVPEIELAIKHYALKARDGKIGIDDLSGGTFTISNGGVYGSLMSTPILNPPQSGILGMHKIEQRPVVVNGEIVIRPMMYLALSYDHRIVDGKEAVSFLVRLKECVEDPARMLLQI